MLRTLHRRRKALVPWLLPKFSSTSSSSPLPPLSALRGTVQPHNALILLHSKYPPLIFPERGPVSEVLKQLQIKAAGWGGVVNWMWDQSWDASEQKGADPEWESYGATIFSRYGQLDLPWVDAGNVDEVGEVIRQFACDVPENQNQELEKRAHDSDEVVHLLVCTHMNRDCRCGERGGVLVQALKKEVERARDTNLIKFKVNIGQLAHVGGHQCVSLLSQSIWLTIYAIFLRGLTLTGSRPTSSYIPTEIGMVFCLPPKFLRS